jgi:hypothetical protein
MKDLLTDRTASVLTAIIAQKSGLHLSEIARLTHSPLSSTQRTVTSLLDEGAVVKVAAGVYRVAPEVPAEALRELTAWRLTPKVASMIEQQVAAMTSGGPPPAPSAAAALKRAIEEPGTRKTLSEMAERLIWWQSAKASLKAPERLAAQVMAIGTSRDIEFVEGLFGEEALRAILASAPAGVFGARRWDYWHLHFGYKRVPPLPAR